MQYFTTASHDLAAAANLLRSGGVVAFPTETVYGLGANAFDAAAVARIFEAKARPTFDPLIVHLPHRNALEDVAEPLTEREAVVARAFWPGPLTLVLRKTARIPGIVTSGLDTVGVRVPAHGVAHELLRLAGVPLAAPSANPFGYLSPTHAEHVVRMLDGRIDGVVDGGATTFGIESTILMLEPEPVLLRHGAVPVEEIEAAIGPVARRTHAQAPAAPGQLEQHYSPSLPLRVVDFTEVPDEERAPAAALAFRDTPSGYAQARALSPRGDLREAAAHLFEVLHALDRSGCARIDVERVPDAGLGAAINDRLRRAAAR